MKHRVSPHDCPYERHGERINCPRCGHNRVWARQDLVPKRNCPGALPWFYRIAMRYPIGDAIALVAIALWIAPAVKWLESKTGVSCGCDTRQGWLNRWHLYQAWRLSMLVSRAKQRLSSAWLRPGR